MRLNDSLFELIGKRISGIVVGQYQKGNPRVRIYFTFFDGTAYELWQDDDVIYTSSGLETGGVDHFAEVMARRDGAVIRVFRPPHEDPDEPQIDWVG